MRKTAKKKSSRLVFRCLAFAAALLLIFVTPLLSQAQYKWTLNGFQTIMAEAFYFDSNYLQDTRENEHTNHTMTGWNGSAKTVIADIRNFENALLSNTDGQDLTYNLTITITLHDPKNGDDEGDLIEPDRYTYDVHKQMIERAVTTGESVSLNGVTKDKAIVFTDQATLSGNGVPKKNQYSITFRPISDDTKLKDGQYIEIEMVAATDESTDYVRTLQTTLYYVASSDGDFMSADTLEDPGNNYLRLTLTSSTVGGLDITGRIIVVWYDTTRLHIDDLRTDYRTAFEKGWTGTVSDNETYNWVAFEIGSQGQRMFEFDKLVRQGNMAPEAMGSSEVGAGGYAVGYRILTVDEGTKFQENPAFPVVD